MSMKKALTSHKLARHKANQYYDYKTGHTRMTIPVCPALLLLFIAADSSLLWSA